MTTLKAWLDGERGRGTRLAKFVEVAQPAISQWAESRVPAERVLRVSEFTGILPNQLRPDIYPATKGRAA